MADRNDERLDGQPDENIWPTDQAPSSEPAEEKHPGDSSWEEHCGRMGGFKAVLTYPDFGTYLGGSST